MSQPRHSHVIDSNKNLWSWGYNGYGGLGDGTTTRRVSPVKIGDMKWSSVSAGMDFSTAITEEGELYAWGNNEKAQVGNGTLVNKLVPTKIGDTELKWNSVSSGGYHTLAITDDGDLYVWGYNTNGQLGLGHKSAIIPTPTKVDIDLKWKQVSAGRGQSYGITDDGDLYAWGSNGDGELGDGTKTESLVPKKIGEAKWRYVVAGSSHGLGIQEDGSLWAWGDNEHGRLGDGTTVGKKTPVKINTEGIEFKTLTAFHSSSAGISTDGDLYTWGYNHNYQLGNGTNVNQLIPTKIGSMKWKSVSAGSSHAIGITEGGELYAWGYNYEGQVGDGSNTDKSTQVKINLEGVAVLMNTVSTIKILNKNTIIKNPATGLYYSIKGDSIVILPNNSIENIIKYGLKAGRNINLNVNFNKTITVNSDGAEIIKTLSSPSEIYEYISDTPEFIFYNETDREIKGLTTIVNPFSVYDYISENPQAIIYTESTDDITISTTTEPYDLYDEFDDEVEVLFYTDDEEVSEADLILEANWSPIDELDGDFEIVTWTDEPQETAQRVLEMTAIPKPQFIKLANPKRLYGYLDDVLAIDASMSYRDEVRYLFTDDKATKWYAWDFNTKKFVEVDASTHELISKNGMKYNELDLLVKEDWRTWTNDHMNIGIFLKDNPRDTIVSVVDTVSYQDYLPRHTTEVEKSNFYILNTTAKINIDFNGNVLKGFLSDDDLTRVQYRVLLNGVNFYPSDGSFTELGESPQNIELALGSKDVKIDDWNTIKVEFQDFFGTTDYWSTNFMGTYSGLMFKDVYGQYYSSEIGEVLQYLDFGVIIAGQTTIEHEVILKNQYGYDVENVHIYANTSNFPTGLECEFSPTQTPFTSHPELKLSGVLKNNEEISFFARLKTVLGATPDANGSFDIIVRADRA